MKTIAAIAAVTTDGIIGNQGEIPWDIPEDRAFFRRTTLGKTVIMGRKTFDSIGGPLQDRRNIVVTRNPNPTPIDGVTFARKPDHAVDMAMLGEGDEAMIIGGAAIYAALMPAVGRLYLTEISMDFAGDAMFPYIDRSRWHERSFALGPVGVRFSVLDRA